MTLTRIDTLRGYADADTPFTVYVRDESGPEDFTGAALEAAVRRHGTDVTTFAVTSSEAGKLSFTLTAETIRSRLGTGLFRLVIRANDRVVYTAHLEIVG